MPAGRAGRGRAAATCVWVTLPPAPTPTASVAMRSRAGVAYTPGERLLRRRPRRASTSRCRSPRSRRRRSRGHRAARDLVRAQRRRAPRPSAPRTTSTDEGRHREHDRRVATLASGSSSRRPRQPRATALWMLADPAGWYAGLPAAVPDFGPLNEHFVRDIGATFTMLGIALALGGRRSRRGACRSLVLVDALLRAARARARVRHARAASSARRTGRSTFPASTCPRS